MCLQPSAPCSIVRILTTVLDSSPSLLLSRSVLRQPRRVPPAVSTRLAVADSALPALVAALQSRSAAVVQPAMLPLSPLSPAYRMKALPASAAAGFSRKVKETRSDDWVDPLTTGRRAQADLTALSGRDFDSRGHTRGVTWFLRERYRIIPRLFPQDRDLFFPSSTPRSPFSYDRDGSVTNARINDPSWRGSSR